MHVACRKDLIALFVQTNRMRYKVPGERGREEEIHPGSEHIKDKGRFQWVPCPRGTSERTAVGLARNTWHLQQNEMTLVLSTVAKIIMIN